MPFSNQSFDAREWAQEFCRLNTATSEGTMIGWFSNALMAGYDHAMRRRQAEIEELTKRLAPDPLVSVLPDTTEVFGVPKSWPFA